MLCPRCHDNGYYHYEQFKGGEKIKGYSCVLCGEWKDEERKIIKTMQEVIALEDIKAKCPVCGSGFSSDHSKSGVCGTCGDKARQWVKGNLRICPIPIEKVKGKLRAAVELKMMGGAA